MRDLLTFLVGSAILLWLSRKGFECENLDDLKAYTRPFTVRINQQISPDDEIIEFICNENQQFRRKIKID